METTTQLEVIVAETGLEPVKAAVITEQFASYFDLAEEWAEKAKALAVNDESQKAEMKMAREGRLFLRNKRLAIESVRKKLKEQSLKEGRAIDSISSHLKALIEPTENYLAEQENFAVRCAAERKEKLRATRYDALAPYTSDPNVYALADLSEEAFTELLNGLLAAVEAKAEAARKAETERVAAEQARLKREEEEAAERERVRAENERLRLEAAQREAELKAEREEAEKQRREAEAKAAAERKELEAKAAAEKQAAEAELRKEREAAENLRREAAEKQAAELKARQEAEAKAAAEEKARLAAEKKAKAAPDRVKLLALMSTLNELPMPELVTTEAQDIISNVRGLLDKVNGYIQQKADLL